VVLKPNKIFSSFYAGLEEPLGVVSIEGTTHYDFTDLPFLSPLAPQLGLKGPINGKRVTVIINDYLLSFFDMTLKGAPTSLFDRHNQRYAEVNDHRQRRWLWQAAPGRRALTVCY